MVTKCQHVRDHQSKASLLTASDGHSLPDYWQVSSSPVAATVKIIFAIFDISCVSSVSSVCSLLVSPWSPEINLTISSQLQPSSPPGQISQGGASDDHVARPRYQPSVSREPSSARHRQRWMKFYFYISEELRAQSSRSADLIEFSDQPGQEVR